MKPLRLKPSKTALILSAPRERVRSGDPMAKGVLVQGSSPLVGIGLLSDWGGLVLRRDLVDVSTPNFRACTPRVRPPVQPVRPRRSIGRDLE